MGSVNDQLEYMYNLERFGIEPGLTRMEAMMELLGHPERKFKAIHISGTNGKGSVAAMLDSVLRESGRSRIGLYTSPHLYKFNERIQVNGQEISDEDLARHVERLRDLIEKHEIQATFFECTTAVAMAYFAEAAVDMAIVEVGMGGLLDATNVVEPLISVITNIGLDHTEYLGDSKEEITREKAGIIKGGAPMVTAERDEKLLNIIREKASEVESQVYEVEKLVSPVAQSPTGRDFLRPQKIAVTGIFNDEFDLPLLGAHQVQNAATALSVLHVLKSLTDGSPAPEARGKSTRDGGLGAGFRPERESQGEVRSRAAIDSRSGLKEVSWQAIRRGMANVSWEGRLDVVSRSPLILVDGAHNNDGVQALYEFIKHMPRHDVLVLGEKKGKDMQLMAELVAPLFTHVIVTKGVYMAEETNVITQGLREAKYKGEIVEIQDAGEAISYAQDGLDDAAMILVAGSLYMVADVLTNLRQREVSSAA